MSRLAFKKATDNPEWESDCTPPSPARALGKRRGKTDIERQVSLREFLSAEVLLSKTEAERQLLTGLLRDLSGTLKLIG